MPFWGDIFYAAGYRTFDFRIERLIAFARVALAAFALLAIHLDPSEPAQNAQVTFAILLGYLVLALIVIFAVMTAHLRPAWNLPLHLTDIGIVTVLMYLSEGAASPFFVFYTFTLLAGTLRWDWRGALWTTTGLIVLIAGLAVANGSGHLSLNDPDYQLNRVIIRAIFLVTAGVMLVSYGVSRERGRDLLLRLSAWPSPSRNPSGTDYCSDLRPAFLHVAATMGARRILVMWEQSEDAGINAILWTDGECRKVDRPHETFDDLVAPELADKTFHTADVRRGGCITSEGTRRSQGSILDRSLTDEFQVHSLVTAAFSGLICRGRIFILDRPFWREDDLVAAEIVAARVGIELEHYTLRSQLEEASAMRERARLARDLHDGLLQSLTAAGLQLKAAGSRADRNSQKLLDNLRELLADEQRRVRSFITSRPAKGSYLQPDISLASVLSQLRTKLELLWACTISIASVPDDATIPRRLVPQIDFILAESIANAVHHGRSSRVGITAETLANHLLLEIRDNGSGLDDDARVHGQSDLITFTREPVSLQSRIAELNGTLSLTSSAAGTTLRIRLPLSGATA